MGFLSFIRHLPFYRLPTSTPTSIMDCVRDPSEMRSTIRDIKRQIEEARERIENIRRGREEHVNEARQFNEQKWRIVYKITKIEMDIGLVCNDPDRKARLEAKLAEYKRQHQELEDRVRYMSGEVRTLFDAERDETKCKLAWLENELRDVEGDYMNYRYMKLSGNGPRW